MNSNLLALSTLLAIVGCTSPTVEENILVSDARDVHNINENALKYNVASDSSYIMWIGSKPAGKHEGTIAVKSATVALENDSIVGGKIVFDINSIKSTDLVDNMERFDRLINHLKSNDFFDAANFPEAAFEITEVISYDSSFILDSKEEFESEFTPLSAEEFVVKNPTHSVTGNLTMRDSTLSITFPAKIIMWNNALMVAARFNLDRTNWNLKYRDEGSVGDKTKDWFIYNTVNISFNLEFVKEE